MDFIIKQISNEKTLTSVLEMCWDILGKPNTDTYSEQAWRERLSDNCLLIYRNIQILALDNLRFPFLLWDGLALYERIRSAIHCHPETETYQGRHDPLSFPFCLRGFQIE